MCEDFDCASDASILLGKFYDKDGKFKVCCSKNSKFKLKKKNMGMFAPQKNERYAQLPCLNVNVMNYIFFKNKESGVWHIKILVQQAIVYISLSPLMQTYLVI